MHHVGIIGTGSYVPERILTNHDLEKMVETSDKWIFERTGIRERRIAAEEETNVVGRKIPHVDLDRALRELKLDRAIVKGEKRDAGLAREADRRAADVNFTARVLVSPEIVSGGQRAIGIGLHPVCVAGHLIRDGSLNVVEPRNAAGRIVLRRGGDRERCE